MTKFSSAASDKEYIVQLYLKYERLMFATARNTAPDLASSWEDIVQDSLEKLIRHVNTLRDMEERALLAYISVTVRNTAVNFVRRQSVKEKYFTGLPEDQSGDADPMAPTLEELVILREERTSLRDAWQQLSETDRVLLRGRYLLQYSDRELAKLLGCRPDSIRMKLTRARRRALKLMLDMEGDPDDKA